MEIKSLAEELNTNTYPGRGIVIGKSKDGKNAVIAYFIMGRSVNSRNRIFEVNDRGGIRTKAFDESKMEDPSLIIYNPVLKLDGKTIVTNGDQTDTIYDFMREGHCIVMLFLHVNSSLMHLIIRRGFQVLLSRTVTTIFQSLSRIWVSLSV